MISFALFGISLQVYMPYYILYLENAGITLALADAINMPGYVVIMAPAIIIAAVFTVFYGRLIDRLGFIKSLIPTLVIYILGLTILSISKETLALFIGCLLMMSGYLSATASFNAVIRKYTPSAKAGLFQGLRMFASVLIPMLIGPWIGSTICGGGATFGVVGESFTVSKYVFLGGLIAGLFVVVPLFFLKEQNENN